MKLHILPVFIPPSFKFSNAFDFYDMKVINVEEIGDEEDTKAR